MSSALLSSPERGESSPADISPRAEANAAQFETFIVTGPRAFEQIVPEWEALDQFATCPMQSYAWMRAAAESFPSGTPFLVAVRREKEITAYAALVKPTGKRRLECLGHELFEPTMCAYADEQSCFGLASALLQLKEPVFLRDIYGDSAFNEKMRSSSRRQVCVPRPMPAHPFVKLNESWLEPEEHLNAGRRSDLRRARRNAERLGALLFPVAEPTTENVDEVMDEVYEVESRNWKGRTGGAIAMNPALQRFYRNYARMAAARGIARVLRMRIGAETVAVQFGVEFNRRFWLLKMGYDESFSRCSPGMLLMLESLRDAAHRGLEYFEMMGQREPWNRVWTDEGHPAVSFRLYAPGLNGLCGAAADVVGTIWRKAKEAHQARASEKAIIARARKGTRSEQPA
jgi:CelD/BcsL family acetyltransferase involved in cellulose biosynthesis